VISTGIGTDNVEILAESIRASAEAAGDLKWTTRGRLVLAQVRLSTAQKGATEVLAREAEQALVVFDRLGGRAGARVGARVLG